MVPVASDRVSRARPYSGVVQGSLRDFVYGAFTLYGVRFHVLPLSRSFVTPHPPCGTDKNDPTTPCRQRPQAITPTWFGLFPFRSPLLRESLLLSFPPVTKMFQFSGFFFLWDFSLGIFWFQCSSSKLFVLFYVPFLLHLKSSVEYLYILSSFSCARGESNPCPDLGRI